MAADTTGRLLVATPAIADGIFDRSVVFVLHHDPVGALGVIINQPTELAIDELLPRWADLALEPTVIFRGGPVEPDGFIAVAERRGELDPDIANPIGAGDLATVDLEADPMLAAGQIEHLRIFRGYAGWAPGQLDSELSAGGWFALEPEQTDLWSHDPATLYDVVLRRQRGELAWFANAPDDASLN